MGRAGANETAFALPEQQLDVEKLLAGRRAPGTQALVREVDYEEFVQSLIHESASRVPIDLSFRQAVREIRAYIRAMKQAEMTPSLAIDFETASKNGRFGLENSSLRTVQIGWGAVPEIGIRQRQMVIDCWPVDSTDLIKIFKDPKVEKQIHNMEFEQMWAVARYGVPIESVYDTCIAWKVIQKRLASLSDNQRSRLGYGKLEAKPNARSAVFFPNTLAALVERELGVKLPKDEQAGDWGRKNLRGTQWVYAAMDVAVLPLLVQRTKEVAAKLGLEEEISEAIKQTDDKIRETTEAKLPEMRDDSALAIKQIHFAATVEELERVWYDIRQLPINHMNQQALQDAYLERMIELAPLGDLVAA